MATNNELRNQLQNSEPQKVNPNQLGLKALMNTPMMKSKFEEVLHGKSNNFIASILNLVNNDSYLAKADAMSIASSAMVAATLDLPIDKNLGYAWIVPYGGKAQFQLGYKGYIQLAQRSGQYKSLNVIEVYDGELKSWNRLSEEFEFNSEGKESDTIIGYVGYFELLNGFKKTVYWTKQEIEFHKRKFSKSDFGWKKDYDAMAKKTVLRNMLSKWGILSVEMQSATTKDETIQRMTDDGSFMEEIKDAEPLDPTEDTTEPETDTKTIDEQVQSALFDSSNPPQEGE